MAKLEERCYLFGVIQTVLEEGEEPPEGYESCEHCDGHNKSCDRYYHCEHIVPRTFIDNIGRLESFEEGGGM